MKYIPFEPEKRDAEKKWSYFNIYYPRNLKDIYNVLLQNPGMSASKDIFFYLLENNIKQGNDKEWSDRLVLEHTNALKKLGLIEEGSGIPLRGKLFTSNIGEELSPSDLEIMKELFNTYFRFNDFARLFEIKNEDENGVVVAYSAGERFFNHIARMDREECYVIQHEDSEIMRFWDVFTKWGKTLNVLSSCKCSDLNLYTEEYELKNAHLFYYNQPMPKDFSVLEFVKENFRREKIIRIVDVEAALILKYRFNVEDIKMRVIEECCGADQYRMQITSEIFIKEKKSRYLYPKVDGSYMSHLLKL